MSFPKPRPRTTPMPVPTHTSAQAGETHFPERGRKRTSLAVTLAAGLVALTLTACSNGEPTAEETVDVYQIAQDMADAEASASASASAAGIDLEEANAQASQEARASSLPSLSPELTAQREQAWDTPAPEIPDEVYEETSKGASATATYFLVAYRYAYLTGDTSLIEQISDSDCVYCNSSIDDALEIHESGGWCDEWQITLGTVSYWDPLEGSDYSRVDIPFTAGKITTHSGDDSQPIVNESADLLMTLAMYYEDGQWYIREAEVNE